MNAEKKESGRGKAAFLALLVVGSVVIFVLGVMVGSNVSIPPEALVGAAGRPGPGDQTARQEIALPRKGEEVRGEEMTFYDTLPGNERTVGAGPPAAEPEAPLMAALPGADAGPTQPAPEAEPSAPEPSAGKTAPAKPPVPPEKAARAAGPFSVQVMATRDEKEAEATAAALAKTGFNTYIVSKNTSKGKFMAVRVGNMATEAETRRTVAEIKAKTRYKDAFLVKE